MSAFSFVTAQHCVDDLIVGETVWYGVAADLKADELAIRRRAALTAFDAQHDLALVTADQPVPGHPTAGVYGGEIVRGQKVSAMGHPTGLWWSYSEGEVAAVRLATLQTDLLDPVGEVWWVQTTAPIAGGSSGGGLWDRDTGQLVAICSRGRSNVLNFWVHRDYLKAFLGKNGIH